MDCRDLTSFPALGMHEQTLLRQQRCAATPLASKFYLYFGLESQLVRLSYESEVLLPFAVWKTVLRGSFQNPANRTSTVQ